MEKSSELLASLIAGSDRISFTLLGGSFCLQDMKISPIDFLSQAESDFLNGGMAANVNCITNAKRAIASQMDQLLTSLGFNSLRWNTPKKTEKLKDLGVLTPSVLRKIVDARNILEHEYIAPTPEETEQFLDISALFVLGSAASFHPFPDEIQVSFLRKEKLVNTIEFAIRNTQGSVFFHGYCYAFDESFNKEEIGEIEVNHNTELFSSLMQACLSLELRYKEETSLSRLRNAIRNFGTSNNQ